MGQLCQAGKCVTNGNLPAEGEGDGGTGGLDAGEEGEGQTECSPVTEICDGLDNDCDGQIDEKERDNEQLFYDDTMNCGECFKECPSGPFSVASCKGGFCYLLCDDGYFDADNDPATGCEMNETGACNISNNGLERCDGVDNDCNGAVDDAPEENMCGIGFVCNKGKCVDPNEIEPCTPQCEGKRCGDDACGGNCGICFTDEICTPEGQCEESGECKPTCAETNCGDDGCGGSCGACGSGERCVFGECTSTFRADDITVTLKYAPSSGMLPLEIRNLFLAFKSFKPEHTVCSDDDAKNVVYPGAQKEPDWGTLGKPKYTNLGGHTEKVEYKTQAGGEGVFEAHVGMATNCISEIPLIGCQETGSVRGTVEFKRGGMPELYCCKSFETPGDDTLLMNITVNLGRAGAASGGGAGVVCFNRLSDAQADHQNCFWK